jgi:hypothetical protein
VDLKGAGVTAQRIGSWWLDAKSLRAIPVEALAVDTADRQRADEWWPFYVEDCRGVGLPVDEDGREHLAFQSGFAAGCLDTRQKQVSVTNEPTP